MGSMSGILRRPLYVAAAVALASISTDLPNKFTNPKLIDPSALHSLSRDFSSFSEASWASHISVSKLANFSFVTRIRVPLPSINSNLIPYCSGTLAGNSVTSSPLLLSLYQSAELSKASKPKTCSYTSKSVPSEDLYRWHLPEPAAVDDKSDCSSVKSRTVVVLLGWLGAKQKHLNKYAEWYTSKGFHAITFTFPMSEVLSYQVGGKAEQDVELLVNHLAEWLEEEHGKNLVIHTFSNTGWLTYGVMLEKFQKQDPSLVGRIKGCIVDSAPVAAPDPQAFSFCSRTSYTFLIWVTLRLMESRGKGTVTSLSSLFSAEEAQKAAQRMKDNITEKCKELDNLHSFVNDNTNLINLVNRLPDELHHQIMVPFGKAAFFPG